MKTYHYILFDLDGTLTDSAEGIINCVLYSLEKCGIQESDREKLKAFVGPPLMDSYKNCYHVSEEEALKLTACYRERFSVTGWKENRVYEGIPEVLDALKKAGRHLILATSKPEVYTKQIMELFGLAQYFELICGATLDGRIVQKGQVIACAISQIGLEHKDEMVMVGDRKYDVYGAAEHGIPCIGVLYGYGSREELVSAGATMLCETVSELPELLQL